MKKLLIAASIATMFSGAAFAAANLDAGTGTGGTYAAEITINGTTGTGLAVGAAADQVATVTFGASFATDAVAYVRFDLPADVTFTANPTYAINDSAAAAATVSVAQGGAGQSFVIFAIAPTLGNNLVNGNTGTFTGAGITVKNQNAVALTYKLFETLTNAANNTLPLKTKSNSLLTFSNAIAITPGAATTQTADVAATTGAYTKFLTATTSEDVLSFTVSHTSRALASGAASVVGDFLAATNAVTLTGDWTARVATTATSGVTLQSVVACDGTGTTLAASAISGATVSFTGITAASITAGAWYACYGVTGTTAIPAASYSGAVDLVANAGYSVSDGSTGTGSIIRNGTVLKAAFAEALSGGSISIYLVNTSSMAAPFTTSCLGSGAQVAGTAGSVPARSTGRYGLTSGLGCPSNTRSVELIFSVPTGSVNGSVLRQNSTTGVGGFDGMVGNQ